MKSLLFKKISISYITAFITIFITSILSFILSLSIFKETNEENLNISKEKNICFYNVKRLNGFGLIKPLMFVDEECEGENLSKIKNEINILIQNHKILSNVSSVSIYLRDFNNGEWMSINDDIQYEPGSLFKVPILISYLKMSENNPSLLNQELLFDRPFDIKKNVAFKSKGITLGNKYKIRDLLKYMIAYSDNNATALLNNNLKPEILSKLFLDLNLEVPDPKSKNYFFTAKNYSLFMRAIYNASYLSDENSEFAAELLEKCDFKEGIISGLPKNVKTVHKFGESGSNMELQLHESAIVYLKNKPYLLTIMTKGKDNSSLIKIISEISSTVYNNMKQQAQ
ncbi:MAG: serine hydrolase [Flavobacterium sp.]